AHLGPGEQLDTPGDHPFDPALAVDAVVGRQIGCGAEQGVEHEVGLGRPPARECGTADTGAGGDSTQTQPVAAVGTEHLAGGGEDVVVYSGVAGTPRSSAGHGLRVVGTEWESIWRGV